MISARRTVVPQGWGSVDCHQTLRLWDSDIRKRSMRGCKKKNILFTEFSDPLVIPITEKFTHFTFSVRRLIRTNIPVREKLGTITIRHRGDVCPFKFEPASWGSLTIFVPNLFCPPTIYMSGVSAIMNGSSLK